MKLCILAMMVAAAAAKGHKYDMRVSPMLHDRTLFHSYFKCAIDQGQCTPGGQRFKELMIEILQHGCSSCTDRQRMNMSKVIWHLKHNEPIWWAELVYKFDPQKIFARKYELVR